jgi:hypothetical protein
VDVTDIWREREKQTRHETFVIRGSGPRFARSQGLWGGRSPFDKGGGVGSLHLSLATAIIPLNLVEELV